VARSSWAARFPLIANLVAFPVLDRVPLGWVIAINKKAFHSPAHAPSANAAQGQQAPPVDVGGVAANVRVVPFRRTDAALLAPFASLLGYHARASQSYNHLRELLVGLTRSLTAAIDAKDSYTFGHSERVARIAVELGRELGLQEDELSDIYLAGLLHDIGKIGIRSEVLLKPSKLTLEEFEEIKQHTIIGADMLSRIPFFETVVPLVRSAHERWDGRGYPDRLRGDAIPLGARIICACDAYNAMITKRPYKDAMPAAEAQAELLRNRGTQFDPAVVDALLEELGA
jgi:putative nucleotidyltransferase with HDIG domain